LLVLSQTVDQPGELRGVQVLAGRTFRVFVTPSLIDVLQVAPLLGDLPGGGSAQVRP
jgi:hypothetical protein